MYEELYEKLPDANRYWEKLGLTDAVGPALLKLVEEN